MLLGTAFIAAWLIGPILVLHYRAIIVPRRYQEILSAFAPDRPTQASVELPIVYYSRLMRPFTADCEPWTFVREQFMRYHGWGYYVAPMLLFGVVTAVSLDYCHRWVAVMLEGGVAGPGIPPAPVIMALLGAYVWSIFEILNRRASGDLTPDDLYDVVVRQFAAVPIGLAFSALVFDKINAAVAFAASAFPLRDLRRLLRQQVLSRVNQDSASAQAYVNQSHISQVIDGIGIETAARLEELHIATAMDLAYTDPVRLMVRTGFSIRHVLSWIDEAMLVVYFGDQRERLLKLAIPCALDLCEFYTNHCYDPVLERSIDCSFDPAVQKVAAAIGVPAELLPERLRALYEDPHVRFLAACWYPGPVTGNGA